MAEFMSEEQRKALEEMKKQKPLDIKVSVSSEEMERLLNEKKALEEKLSESETEKEDAQEKLRMVAQIEFEKKKRQLGAPESVDTPEKLMGFELAKEKSDMPDKKSAGTVPLHSQNEEGYDSIEDMINDIRQRRALTSPNSDEQKEYDAILNELTKKTIEGIKSEKRGTSAYEYKGSVDALGQEKGMVESLNEELRKRKLAEYKKRKESV